MIKFCNAIYWLALTIWCSVLVSAGIPAVSAFTVLPDPALGLHLDAFEQYDEASHGRIAAGHVMEPIFTFVDFVQAPISIIAIAMLLLQLTFFKMPWRSPANIVRSLALILGLALFAWRIVVITPDMNLDLRSYWHAAQIGDVAQADTHLASFNVNHPRAERLMTLTLVMLFIAVGASAAAFTARPLRGKIDSAQSPKRKEGS